MEDRSCITVFIPTPLIFRYYLPLSTEDNSAEIACFLHGGILVHTYAVTYYNYMLSAMLHTFCQFKAHTDIFKCASLMPER